MLGPATSPVTPISEINLMNDKPVILINVFTVDPERQLELIELLTRATED